MRRVEIHYTNKNQCNLGEGDCDKCDKDSDCLPGLKCGVDNCVGDSFQPTDDCCFSGNYCKTNF